MTDPPPYGDDLAYIHDQGFGGFARGSAPGLLRLMRNSEITCGRVVDLGCGSGVWAAELALAGFEVVGVDVSPAMIDIARRRAPGAGFHVGSIFQFPIPPCSAVTALGEVFNYRFDSDHSQATLRATWRRIFDALSPGGLLVFDVAGPGRCRGRTQSFVEGDGWTCLVEYQHDEANQCLTRRIVTFRDTGAGYRRREETHSQQLLEEGVVAAALEQIGFTVRTVRRYGEHPLAESVVGIVGQKPR